MGMDTNTLVVETNNPFSKLEIILLFILHAICCQTFVIQFPDEFYNF